MRMRLAWTGWFFSGLLLPALLACGSGGQEQDTRGLADVPDTLTAPDPGSIEVAPEDLPAPACRFPAPPPAADGAIVAMHGFTGTPSLPFPSDIFTKPSEASPSGVILDIREKNTLLLDPALSFLTSLEDMLKLLSPIDGFSTWTPVLVALSGLPAQFAPIGPAESLSFDSPVFLVEVDKDSGSCSQRHPITVTFESPLEKEGVSTLMVIEPYLPLKPATRYAAIVTRGLSAASGASVVADEQFGALVGCGGAIPAKAPADRVARARESLSPLSCDALSMSAPVIDAVSSGASCGSCLATLEPPLCPCDLAVAAVFTTASPASPLERIRSYLRGPASLPLNLTTDPDGDGLPDLYAPGDLPGVPPEVTEYSHTSLALKGAFDMPDLRCGDGDFPLSSASPLQASETLRLGFVLMLPDESAKPPFRLVVLGHGHSGYKEQIGYLADRFGEQGLALAAIDAVGHGDLKGKGKFMTANIAEVRGSFVQTQADELRLFQALEELTDLDVFPPGAPDGVPDLDLASGIGFIGESLGGLTGTPACAVEPMVKAAVFNVSGGGMSAFAMGEITSMLPPGNELLLWSLKGCAQTLLQHMDPMSFTYLLGGDSPRSVLMQAVVGDELLDGPPTYDMARALDLTYVCPCPKEVPDLPTAAAPFTGNGLYYFGAPAIHGFLIAARQNPEASDGVRKQAAWFLKTALTDGKGDVIDGTP